MKLDNTVPTVVSINTDKSVYQNGDTLILSANLGETGLKVTGHFSEIDSGYTTGAESVNDHGDGTYTISYKISAENLVANNASLPIRITTSDDAGNTAESTPTVELDNTAIPTIIPATIQTIPAPPAGYKISSMFGIKWGEYTFWLYDDSNNEGNFLIVGYDSNENIVKQNPYSYYRYVEAIKIDIENQKISFTMQSNTLTINWADLQIN